MNCTGKSWDPIGHRVDRLALSEGIIRMDFAADSHKISRMVAAQLDEDLAPISEGQADGRDGSSA